MTEEPGKESAVEKSINNNDERTLTIDDCYYHKKEINKSNERNVAVSTINEDKVYQTANRK
ncbi:46361_t:CDS:2, partial [Gigaspora margarita]